MIISRCVTQVDRGGVRHVSLIASTFKRRNYFDQVGKYSSINCGYSNQNRVDGAGFLVGLDIDGSFLLTLNTDSVAARAVANVGGSILSLNR